MLNRLVVAVALTACVGSAVLIGQTPRQADVVFKAAQHKEEVEGDLRGAIDLYRQVVETAGSNRALAAQALLRMADVYQKLGDSRSRDVYTRIVRDYGDRPEAASARAWLSAQSGGSSSARVDRVVWAGPTINSSGRVSPDGRYISFTDYQHSNNLAVHDTVTNTDRALTTLTTFDDNPSWVYQGEAHYSVFSRDGKQIAFGWLDARNRASLRVMDVAPTGSRAPRTVVDFDHDEVRYAAPADWSADGSSIAVLVIRRDNTSQIWIVKAKDGSYTVLQSLPWGSIQEGFFSPDGRYLAYDAPVREADGPFDVFVLRTDGSGQVAAVDHPAHDEVMGWSPDGRLLFTSDRTGSDGLWAQTMADGRPKGSPDLLRADIGEFTYPAGITSSGSLYVFKRVGNLDVQVATVDFESGRLSSPPRGFTKGFRFDPRLPGAWSPDGKLLAYPTACQDTWCVTIRSVETGESRQLPIKTVRPMLWWPDSRSVGVNRDDGITRIDVETGAVLERITIPVRCIGQRRLTPDGSTLIYVRTTCRVDPNGGVAVVERNLRTGVERDVFTGTGLGGDIDVSPDGTHVAVKQLDGASRTTRLLVIPFKAGAPREVLTAKEPDLLGAVEWAPDSKRLVVGQRVSSETMVSIVPTDGSPSKKLDLGPDFGRSDGGGSGFRVSRDGRIALLVGSNSREVWALENILPR